MTQSQRVLGRDILKCVAKHAEVSVEEIRGKDRQQWISNARMLVCYLTVRHCPWLASSSIGRMINKDRTTADRACNRIAEKLATDPEVKYLHDAVVEELGLNDPAPFLRVAQ